MTQLYVYVYVCVTMIVCDSYSCGQTGAGYTRRGNVWRNNRMEHSHRRVFTPNPGAFGNLQVFTLYVHSSNRPLLVGARATLTVRSHVIAAILTTQ